MDGVELADFVSFGTWVERRRKAMEMTRADLANLVGCAVVTIKKIERDERKPSPQMAQLLLEHLAIPDALQGDFLQMARGMLVTPAQPLAAPLRIPAFLHPDSSASVPRPVHFVGRKPELARLDSCLKQALAGNGTPVFILGEAGSGKTTLMGELARRATETQPNLLVVGGEGNAQAGAGDPYRPFRDVLKMLTGQFEVHWANGPLDPRQALRIWEAIPDTIRALTADGPGLINIILPAAPVVNRVEAYLNGPADWLGRFQVLARSDHASNTRAAPDPVLEAMAQVLKSIAARHPLLVLLDDLQWFDEASKNLLFHLGRQLAGSRILLVCAYRLGGTSLEPSPGPTTSADEHSVQSMLLELTRRYGNIQINLNQASQSEGRAFVDALLDRDPNALTERFRENLFRHTRGQPLFTVEILQSMRESGNLIQDAAGRWVENATPASYPLPARVEAVVAQRLGRLSPALRELLSVASVEGEVFTAEVVADILALDLRGALQHLSLDLKQRHRLVQEVGEITVGPARLNRFQFRHALFQEYLYNQLGQSEKSLLHRKVAAGLEKALFGEEVVPADGGAAKGEEAGGLEQFGPALVNHFWLGEVWDKAATYALQLGQQARSRFAMREAITYYERALDALDHQSDAPYPLVFEALLGWEDAAFNFRTYEEQLGQLRRAERLAREHQDAPRLIQALHWTANVFLARGLWTQAGPALSECLTLAERLGDERLSVRPMFFKGLMTSFADPPSALTWLNRALGLAQSHHDQQVEAIALGVKGQVEAQLGEFAQSQEAIQCARQVVGQLDSPLTESDVDLLAAWAYLAMGEAQQGLELGKRSVEVAIATDNMDCLCSGLACIGYGNLELRRIPEAIAAFREGIERSAISGAIIPKLNGQAGLVMARFCAGETRAIEDMEGVLTDMRLYQFYVGEANANRMLGTCLAQLGALDRAENHLSRAIDFYRQSGMRPYLMNALSALATVMEKQGRRSEADNCLAEAAALRQAVLATAKS